MQVSVGGPLVVLDYVHVPSKYSTEDSDPSGALVLWVAAGYLAD